MKLTLAEWTALHDDAPGDDEERARFRAVLRGAASAADFRAWLVLQPDNPRGAWLRACAALERCVDEGARAALDDERRRLEGSAPPAWRALVRRPSMVRNCGQARGAPPLVRFSFVCPRAWEALATTSTPGERTCDGCGETVHWCDSREQAAAHARAGRCIAVSGALVEGVFDERSRSITGRPTPEGLLESWAADALDEA